MNVVRTIDLWTEQKANHYECFNGAFIDGIINNNSIPFNSYKVIKNCNCIISCDNEKFRIRNKHNAIIFYKGDTPVRLVVLNKDTNIDMCIENAINQHFNGIKLNEIFEQNNIKRIDVDLHQEPILNGFDGSDEIDVGSCDRWGLLCSMLKGSYTESDSNYGNYTSDKYEFLPELNLKYELVIYQEHFCIEHRCAFINDLKTRIIPIQDNSKLTDNTIEE